jgi:hypothetical protein
MIRIDIVKHIRQDLLVVGLLKCNLYRLEIEIYEK